MFLAYQTQQIHITEQMSGTCIIFHFVHNLNNIKYLITAYILYSYWGLSETSVLSWVGGGVMQASD